MTETKQTDASEATLAVELAQVDAVEAQEVETELQAVENEAAEVEESTVEAVELEAKQAEPVLFSQADLVKMATDFGAEVTAQVVAKGGNYQDARELAYQGEKAELEALRKEVAQLKASRQSASGASPIAFADGEKRTQKPKRLRDACFTAK